MTDHKLLRSQMNEVFEHVKRSGLSVEEFSWKDTDSRSDMGGKIPVLIHVPSNYYFCFDRSSAGPYSLYSPGHDNVVASSNEGAWTFQLLAVKKWLAFLKRELSAPDLWTLIGEEKQLVKEAAAQDDNSPFNAKEQARISSGIRELTVFVTVNIKGNDAHLNYIVARLNHLEDASKRLGRKDWIQMAVGVITNIVVGVSLAPEAAKDLFKLAGSLFSWIGGSIPMLH